MKQLFVHHTVVALHQTLVLVVLGTMAQIANIQFVMVRLLTLLECAHHMVLALLQTLVIVELLVMVGANALCLFVMDCFQQIQMFVLNMVHAHHQIHVLVQLVTQVPIAN